MFDGQLQDYWEPPETPRSQSLIEQLAAAGRAENQAAARRLTAVADLFEMRRAERGEEPDWAVDTWAAVAAEVAAALRTSLGRAGSFMTYALGMRRLPNIAAAFASGDIDMDTYRILYYRTELITDPEVLARVDALLAALVARWPAMTRGRLITEIDRVLYAHDRDAVRRTRRRSGDREITVWHREQGDLSQVSGQLMATDAHLLDKRLDELAATVCAADPRTKAQRRADALGALAAGGQRLRCQCEHADCPAASVVPAPVVIHVVAEQSAVDGQTETPGYLVGTGALISAELLRTLAAAAKIRPLITPGPAPEPRYRPSRALADFVRARDLTCRAPGCDHPATDCQIDHTVPFADGGATHASNLKALCVFHHIVKTFWGWRDRQLSNGTIIWTLPGGQTYITTPGSALLFPALTVPTGDLPTPPPRDRSPDDGPPSARLPRRKRSRAQNRTHRIASERNLNRRQRRLRHAEAASARGQSTSHDPDGDEPPF